MGSNSPLRTDGILSSVKTGTTDNFRDNWTVGYTQNVAVGVWVGNTDSTEMQGTTGLTGAAPIWNQVITSLYSDPGLFARLEPVRSDEVAAPRGLHSGQLCELNAVTQAEHVARLSAGSLGVVVRLPATCARRKRQSGAASGVDFAPTPSDDPPMSGPRSRRDSGRDGLIRFGVRLARRIRRRTRVGWWCRRRTVVPNEVVAQVASAVTQVFIKAPPFADEDIYARLYAAAAGLAIAPRDACTSEMLASGGSYAAGVTAQILSPSPGETTYGPVVSWARRPGRPGRRKATRWRLLGRSSLTGRRLPVRTRRRS